MHPAPARVLGLGQLVAIVIGAVIGVGIFFTPAQVARIAGSQEVALGLWALGGFAAAMGGIAFAELGRRFPHAGGQYRVVRAGWGPFPAYVYVVCLLTAIQSGAAAAIAQAAARNLAVAAGVQATPDGTVAVALALIAGVVVTNVLGVRQGTAVQVFTVAAKLTTLGFIVALAAGSPTQAAPPAAPAPAAGLSLLAGLIPAMFSYGGWQHALWMAGEVKDPERALPRGIGIGVAVVVVAYLSATWAYFRLLGYDGVVNAGALAAEAVGVVLPGLGERVVAAAVAVSAYGVLNAQFLAGPRQVWALARDGLFFQALGHLHPVRGTPHLAILALGGCATVATLVPRLAGLDGLGALTAWTVVVDTLFFVLTAAVLIKLQAEERRFTPSALAAALFIATMGIALVGAMADQTVRLAALSGVVWVSIVSGSYFAFRR